nr:hybrid sensor histidine kinase/response regulator [Rhodoblastus acidophilus]
MATSADRYDLSRALEWCESATDADVTDIAAGGCRFAPATPAALSLGYSSRAFWLRLTLVNPEPRAVERWLQVGQSRLERVSFFEQMGDGSWKRSDAGLAVPAAQRPVLSVDPLLPLTLAPLESRTLLVRIVSRTSINLTSILWRPRAYADVQSRVDFHQALALGGLVMAALVSLMIALAGRVSQWSGRANLYFSASLLSKAVFNACITGQLPAYILPDAWAFDVRVQAVAMGAAAIFFLFFLRHFAETHVRYPCYDRLFRILIGVLSLEIGGALIDFGAGFRSMTLTTFAVLGSSVTLMWRAWRNGLPASFYLLLAFSINLSLMIHRIAMAFAGSYYSDELVLAYSWIHLLTVPLTPIGIALHEETIRRDLNQARKEAAARVEFLARMSHELRTPLDTILGNAQLLSRPNGKVLMAEGLATIQDSGWRLLRMIDDILDHARGLAGKLTIAPVTVDWPAFLRAVEADAERIAARAGNGFTLRLQGLSLQRIRLDHGRLRQVLDNLIANAARHTVNGRIELDCLVGPASKERMVILDFRVTDSGEGIALADHEQIFLPFQRGRHTVSRYGGKGVGMGLTISRQLVEMMGGRLTVKSRPGEGACFRFQVMAEQDDAAAASPGAIAHAGGYDGTPRTLLLVDDDDESRRVLAKFFRGAGFEVMDANSGRAALEVCAAARPDLVLTDQFMADGDGWMVLKAMSNRYPDVPVISISAAPLERPARFPDGINFAMDLLKPLDHGKVLCCVSDLLGLAWTRDGTTEPTPATLVTSLERPDPVLISVLSAMTVDGRISDILSWADDLKAAQPRCASFADEVHAAASRIDFQTLKTLCEAVDASGSTKNLEKGC